MGNGGCCARDKKAPSFLKKRSKKLFPISVHRKWIKVFCFFFSKKKVLLAFRGRASGAPGHPNCPVRFVPDQTLMFSLTLQPVEAGVTLPFSSRLLNLKVILEKLKVTFSSGRSIPEPPTDQLLISRSVIS